MLSRHAQSLIALHAAQMRSHLPASEARLWEALRCRRLEGVLFKRQVVVGGKFVADFLAPAAKLIVEVDGGYHQRQQAADARRDAKLARWGYRVLRLPEALVMQQLPIAVARVRAALRAPV